MRLSADNLWAVVTAAEPDELRWLETYLTVQVKNAEHSDAYQNGVWDGTVKLYDRKRSRLASGLLRLVGGRAREQGIAFEVHDARVKPTGPVDAAAGAWLRPYQRQALDVMVSRGRGIVAMPTGSGKTEVFSALGQAVPIRWLVLVDTKDLMHQAADRFLERTGERAGLAGDGEWEPRRFTVATLQTLLRGLKDGGRVDALLDAAQGIVGDECFPAGVMVGDRPIEEIRVGDFVPSYDEATSRFCSRMVVRTFSSVPGAMVRVEFEDGSSIACTPRHPFMTVNGWVAAENLCGEDVLKDDGEKSEIVGPDAPVRLLRDAVSAHQDRVGPGGVLRCAPGRASPSASQSSDLALSYLSGPGRVAGATGFSTGQERGRVLLEGAPETVVPRSGFQDVERDGPEALESPVRQDANEQPHGEPGGPRARGSVSEGQGKLVSQWSRRQRTPVACSAGETPGSAGDRVGRGISSEDRIVAEGRRRIPHALQDRRRSPAEEDCGRGGRSRPRLGAGSPARREEVKSPAFVRVARVSVLESGGDGTYGGLCPGGLVYNIEVEKTHTYLVNGIVVHNCQVVAADEFRKVAMATPNAWWRFGVSATPLEREDESDYRAIEALGPLILDVKPKSLIEAGWLARPDVVFVRHRHERMTGTFPVVYEAGVVLNAKRNAVAARLASDPDLCPRPGLVFFRAIAHGRQLVKAIEPRARIEMVDGSASAGKGGRRDGARHRLRMGLTDVLACSKIFNKGIDIPEVESAVNAAAGASRIDALQKAGRLMRVAGDKRVVRFWDFYDEGNHWLEGHARARIEAFRSREYDVRVVDEADLPRLARERAA